MRMHDIGQVLIVLALGFLLGGLTTFFAYGAVTTRRVEGERQQYEQSLRDSDQEREQLQKQVDQLRQEEQEHRQAAEQGEDDPPRKAAGVRRRPGDLQPNDQ